MINLLDSKKNRLIALMLGLAMMPLVTMAQNDRLIELLRNQLSRQEIDWAQQALAWPQLQEFYALYDYQPVWIKNDKPTSHAVHWRLTLKAADAEGLDPERYHLSSIDQYWDTESPQQLVWLELLLTDAFLHYSSHVRIGRLDPLAVDPDWHIATPEIDAVTLLRNTLAAENFAAVLRTLPPPHAGYQHLRKALAHYLRIEQQGAWHTLPAGPKLYWGMWHDHVPLLRKRLVLSGDLQPGPVLEARFFNQSVKQAVERWQFRHGFKVDGIVGAATRTGLNVPISDHIKQIKLNMERWRWLPRQLGKRYIMVNTASYQLFVFEHDKPRLAMKTIIGKPERPTPVIGGKLRSIILNPYWFIPKKIALEDLIPQQIRNRDFFKSKHIQVLTSLKPDAMELDPLDIDWSLLTEDNFPYILRQAPGPNNSLGRIKFPFLNAFAIYLHDTPQRQLFDQSSRAFSSGCIRVEEPLRLATYLLDSKQGWNRSKILETIESGNTIRVQLPEPIPIYLVYWTAWVGADDAVYFYKDVYGRDRPLEECS